MFNHYFECSLNHRAILMPYFMIVYSMSINVSRSIFPVKKLSFTYIKNLFHMSYLCKKHIDLPFKKKYVA